MADIELVIKVDERDVDFVRKTFKPTGCSFIPLYIQNEFVSAILNGVSLPKSHGKLKDTDAIIDVGFSKGFCDWYYEIKYAPTIIEADKAENEDEDVEYQRQIEQLEHNILYEPTFNPEDGSM